MSNASPSSPHPLAVVAADAERRAAIQLALKELGYQVVICAGPAHLDEDLLSSNAPEAWVVELEMNADEAPFLELLMDTVEAPVLFGDGQVPQPGSDEFASWRRRMSEKLVAFLESPLPRREFADAEGVGGDRMALGAQGFAVWVLAASLGGPQAVKLFLDSLPPGLPVAFLYAQHIDAGFQHTLQRVLARHSAYEMEMATDGGALRSGLVSMLPAQTRINVSPGGILRDLHTRWGGPYNPCIDEVLGNVARSYGASAGAIIFSGMGEEGCIGSEELVARGGRVWLQDAASCACSSMPDAVAARLGSAVIRQPPERLAGLLAATLQGSRAATTSGEQA